MTININGAHNHNSNHNKKKITLLKWTMLTIITLKSDQLKCPPAMKSVIIKMEDFTWCWSTHWIITLKPPTIYVATLNKKETTAEMGNGYGCILATIEKLVKMVKVLYSFINCRYFVRHQLTR